MIRIYDKDEVLFDNMGIGGLPDAISILVTEKINDSYELEMDYPVSGSHYKDLVIKNFILCKPSRTRSEQPFRIYSISKPLDGTVTVSAEHISYDASGNPVLPIRSVSEDTTDTDTATNVGGTILPYGDLVTNGDDKEGCYLDTTLRDINKSAALQDKNYFVLSMAEDKENTFKENGFSIPGPTNLRALLGTIDDSLITSFVRPKSDDIPAETGEFEFDFHKIIFHNQRGKDRGVNIRYGKNMTDLEQDITGSNVCTGIFPFYSKKYTETVTESRLAFQYAYIVQDKTPFTRDWLSVEAIDITSGLGGIPLLPTTEFTKKLISSVEGAAAELVEQFIPMQIKTKSDKETGEYYDKVYVYLRCTEDRGTLIKVYANIETDEADVETVTSIKLTEDGEIITPEFGKIYVVQNETSKLNNKNIIFDKGTFVQYPSFGYYTEAVDSRTVDENTPLPLIIPVHPIKWDAEAKEWVQTKKHKDPNDDASPMVEDFDLGKLYVRPMQNKTETISTDKYVYLDLKEYEIVQEEGQEVDDTVLNNGIIYVSEEAKNRANQRIVTLDLTSAIAEIDTSLNPEDFTSKNVFDKAKDYLKENDLINPKETITVSFINLSDSDEYEQLKKLEVVELGDTVGVLYEDIGVNSKRRVISTEYDAIANQYTQIELGDAAGKITNNVVSMGDSITTLKNTANYTSEQNVVKLIAENIEVVSASIQKAVITTLLATSANISGLLSASSASIGSIVAQMMITDNAEIANLLKAGSLEIAGNITALSGTIGGAIIQNGILQIQNANISEKLTAAQIDATDLEVAAANVTGTLTAEQIDATDLEVDAANVTGTLTAEHIDATDLEVEAANVAGTLSAVDIRGGSIEIGDFIYTVKSRYVIYNSTPFTDGWLSSESPSGSVAYPESDVVYLIDDSNSVFEGNKYTYDFYNEKYVIYEPAGFAVDEYGNAIIKKGTMNIQDMFMIDSDGTVIIKNIILNSSNNDGSSSISISGGKLTVKGASLEGTIKTEEVSAKKILIDDALEFSSIKASLPDTETVTYTPSVYASTDVDDNRVNVSFSSDLENDASYTRFSFSWRAYVNGHGWMTGSGTTMGVTNNTETGVYLPRYSSNDLGGYISQVELLTYTPKYNVNNIYTDQDAIGVGTNFAPLTDNTRNLGGPSNRWKDVYSAGGVTTTSDKRQKKEINYNIDLYSPFFDELKPASFKFIDGKSNRTHMGFISQDLRDSLTKIGMTSLDFAGYIKSLLPDSIGKDVSELTEDDYAYGIRYSELHAMEVNEIQKLKNENKKLKAKIEAIELKLKGL